MTKDTGEELLQPFIEQCDKDADPYFIVHFSRSDDWFNGLHDRMDFADALIIVSKLIELFEINPLILSSPSK